ncbi:MAG: NYN domain-containing protein [Pseudomonadota bacterium]
MTGIPQFNRVAVFVDHANINRSARDQSIEIDYQAFLEYLVAGRHLIEAITHVPVDPRNPSAMDQGIEELWLAGYLVKPKLGKIAGETYKCNVDVEMTIDMLNAGLDMNIDTIILVSGDGDFLPVVEYLRGRGIRVEVCGFEANMARELILKSSGCIIADEYFNQEHGEEFDED